MILVLIRFSQGDLELPEVPSEPLPEASEKKPGQFKQLHEVLDGL